MTVKDIAKLAGVSRGTVDRALNNRKGVAEATRQLILEIAENFGYEKNEYASSLAQNRVLTICIVLPYFKEGSFWADAKLGLNKALDLVKHAGIQVKYFHFDAKRSEDYSASLMLAVNERPEAILLAPIFYGESLQFLQIAAQNNIPVVTINTDIGSPDIVSFIGQDSFRCGRLAGQLIRGANSYGQEIAVITLGNAPGNAKHIEDKITGLRQYNYEQGLKFNIVEVNIASYLDHECVDAEIQQLFSLTPGLRALFFTNARAHHFIRRIPEPIMSNRSFLILGFDPIPKNISLMLDDQIDILINQDPAKQAEMAILSIYERLVHNNLSKSHQYIPPDIVVKENYDFYIS